MYPPMSTPPGCHLPVSRDHWSEHGGHRSEATLDMATAKHGTGHRTTWLLRSYKQYDLVAKPNAKQQSNLASSMKTMHGAIFRARSKSCKHFGAQLSLYGTHENCWSPRENTKKWIKNGYQKTLPATVPRSCRTRAAPRPTKSSLAKMQQYIVHETCDCQPWKEKNARQPRCHKFCCGDIEKCHASLQQSIIIGYNWFLHTSRKTSLDTWHILAHPSHPASAAQARASKVFPDPGGPALVQHDSSPKRFLERTFEAARVLYTWQISTISTVISNYIHNISLFQSFQFYKQW